MGVSFGAAWPRALPFDEEWREVLEATREGWARAYERLPATRGELALRAAGWDDEREAVDSDRWCARPGCAQAIPARAHWSRRYCCRECQRAANGRPATTGALAA